MSHLFRNNFNETYNSRRPGGNRQEGELAELSLKQCCFDEQLENYGQACSAHKFYKGKTGKLMSALQKMDHGQVIINSYAPVQGFFGNHIDRGTYGVVLWS